MVWIGGWGSSTQMFAENSWIGLHGHHSALLAAIEDLHYTISLAY